MSGSSARSHRGPSRTPGLQLDGLQSDWPVSRKGVARPRMRSFRSRDGVVPKLRAEVPPAAVWLPNLLVGIVPVGEGDAPGQFVWQNSRKPDAHAPSCVLQTKQGGRLDDDRSRDRFPCDGARPPV